MTHDAITGMHSRACICAVALCLQPPAAMKTLCLLPLLLSSKVLAVPSQTVLGDLGDLSAYTDTVFHDIAKGAKSIAHNVLEKSKDRVEQWMADGKSFVKQHDLVCESQYPSMYRVATEMTVTQMNSSRILRLRTISYVLGTLSCAMRL
jgi:hypothetical protein